MYKNKHAKESIRENLGSLQALQKRNAYLLGPEPVKEAIGEGAEMEPEQTKKWD